MHLAGMILPIFAIILTGWLARVSGYMPHALAPSLMRFAYYVAMPALVFLTIADESLHSLLEWRFLAAFGGGSMLCFAVMVIFERIVHKARWRHCGMRAAESGVLLSASPSRIAVAILTGSPWPATCM